MSTPLLKGKSLSKEMEMKSEDDFHFMETRDYKGGVGSIMYLMLCTRPDLAFPVGVLSRHLSNAGPDHWKAFVNIMSYVMKTSEYSYYLRRIILWS